MTVENITPTTNAVFTGPGDYTFSFYTHRVADLIVTHTSIDGTDTIFTYLTDYTVTLNSGSAGGTVTVSNEDFSNGTLRIDRVLPFTQEIDLVNAGPLDVETLEQGLDRAIMLLQQMNQEVLAGTSAFEWEGVWATATSYSVRALIEGPDGNWYYCNQAHTSGTFSTDLASGLWVLLINRASLLESVADAETAEENAETAQAAAEAAQLAAEAAQAAAEYASLVTIPAWEDDPTSYDYPDVVAATDGYSYRCIGADVVGEDPASDDGTYWTRLPGIPIVTVADEGKALIVDSSGDLVATAIPQIDTLHAIGNAGTTQTLDTVSYDTFTFVCDQTTLDLSGSSIAIGRTVTLVISGGDGCTITWPTGIQWPGGTEPSLSSGTDRVVLQRISSTVIQASLAGAAYA